VHGVTGEAILRAWAIRLAPGHADEVILLHGMANNIHGLVDNNVPPYNSEMILAASQGRNPNVSLWEPPDAGHCGAMEAEPGEFERRVAGWFQSLQASTMR
jgi:fermentation-respiration switch protein FrsA (DUF1100 family)